MEHSNAQIMEFEERMIGNLVRAIEALESARRLNDIVIVNELGDLDRAIKSARFVLNGALRGRYVSAGNGDSYWYDTELGEVDYSDDKEYERALSIARSLAEDRGQYIAKAAAAAKARGHNKTARLLTDTASKSRESYAALTRRLAQAESDALNGESE